MKKALKRLLITVLVLALIGGGIYGGLMVYKKTQTKPVNVYSLDYFAMTDYWGDASEAYGMVTTDKIQTIMLSDTQTVTEVFVTEGQEVHVGDPLCAFDTTLSDIDLEKAEISYRRMVQSLDNAEKELEAIKKMRPFSMVLITPESTGIVYESLSTPQYISGTGTEDDPLYYLWGENDTLSFARLQSMVDSRPSPAPQEPEEGSEPGNGENEQETEETVDTSVCYIALVTRYKNALNGYIKDTVGLKVNTASGNLSFKIVDPNLSPEIMAYEEEPQPYYQYYGSGYTSAQLAEMASSKEEEIKDLKLQIQIAEVELEQLRKEVNDGVVCAKIDGVIKTLTDPDSAQMMGESFLTVSGGGGFYITVAMSEMDLETVHVGQTVNVMSWRNGVSCEGTIVEISEYPTDNADSWSAGNTNVSYYPFTVFVDEDAELTEYDYVSITYQNTSGGDDGTFYLEAMLVRNDGGKSYVYVRGEDGRLEQRTVQTGKNLWGSYIQIKGGITLEDKLAFPYGTDVKSGAETVEAGIEEFYGSYY